MKRVSPSVISGTIKAPPSKSVTIRAIAASALTPGRSILLGYSSCSDALSALQIIKNLGSSITEDSMGLIINGNGFPGGNTTHGLTELPCGESGLCMRMFAPIAALADGRYSLTATGSLSRRPMGMAEALNSFGIECTTTKGTAPVTVKGPLSGGHITVDGSESSQFLTGLLMALPLARKESMITVKNPASTPYIALTLSLLEKCGITIIQNGTFHEFAVPGKQSYSPLSMTIEGDWSGAAFLFVAGAIAGAVTVTGLGIDSFQGDRKILEALSDAGAEVTIGEDAITVARNTLKAFTFDASDCPDLVPPLAALAAHCEGKSTITGVERLRYKESDRIRALVAEFARLGVLVEGSPREMMITGGSVSGGYIDPRGDHRIAMACAVAALNGSEPVIISNARCVAKSYPDFFSEIERVRTSS